MSKPNLKKDIFISIGIALILLCLLFLAKSYPVQSYKGTGLCGEVEKFTIISGEAGDYERLVGFYKDNRGEIDITDGVVDSAKACPQGGKISLYLL